MTTANIIQNAVISPASSIVHDSTTYTININHLIDKHVANNYAIIVFPNLIEVPASPSCSATSGTITCSKLSAYQLKAVYDTTPADTIEFTLTNIINYDLADYDVTFSISIYDSENYLMEVDDEYNLTFVEATFSSITANNDDNIALGEASNITLTITNGFSIDSSFSTSLTKLTITIPN